MRCCSRTRLSKGFTLVELIITIVLVGILAAVGANMIADSFSTSRIVNNNNASVAQARYALERMAREIREVKYDTVNGVYCINTLTTSGLVFYKTVGTYNSTCSTNAIVVSINRSGANLTLGYSSPASTSNLINQITSFALTYRDSNNCTTTLIDNSVGTADCVTPGGIRFVDVSLTVAEPGNGVQSTEQRTRAALRNQ